MSVEIRGFEEMEDELARLQEQLESFDGSHELSMSELFTKDFMTTYTDFDSIQELFEASPWTVESQENFEQIPVDEFDEFVDEYTGFNSWEVMLSAAGREWVTRQLAA